MRMMLSSRRRHYVARVSIFLVTVALIVGMVGCAQPAYNLAIVSTAGGNVTTPGEGMFTYDEGTVVNLTAEAEEGYRFVNWTGNVATIADVYAAATDITINSNYFVTANFEVSSAPMLAASVYHTVGLKTDGTVVAVGDNEYGECNVGGWTDITGVAAGCLCTVGLKSDGTVVAVGLNDCGQCNISDWMNITQVAAGRYHTVGLKADGTVVAVGNNQDGRCDVGGWADIVQVAAGMSNTVRLKADGTAVAAGWEAELAKWNLG